MAIHINAGDLVEAMTSGDDELQYYLDQDTGAVGPIADDELDTFADRRLVPVPSLDTGEAFEIMERFVHSVSDPQVRSLLRESLAGKGPFRRFREAVRRRPEVSKAWDTFHDRAVLESAAEWLEDEGIAAIIDRAE